MQRYSAGACPPRLRNRPVRRRRHPPTALAPFVAVVAAAEVTVLALTDQLRASSSYSSFFPAPILAVRASLPLLQVGPWVGQKEA
jgi:hypothetical protein